MTASENARGHYNLSNKKVGEKSCKCGQKKKVVDGIDEKNVDRNKPAMATYRI